MTQPTRPYDALYDTTFTVAGARDHYRQQTLGGGFNIERAPIYNNFFSELPQYPPSTLRLKNGDRLPAFVDRNYHQMDRDPTDLQQRSDAMAVSGGQRPKYFRRPLLAAAEIHVKQAPLPPLPAYPDLNATAPAAIGGPEPRSKTIGTQSDYRENEAQTAPWEPDFVLPTQPSAKQQALSRRHHTDGPEVLHLRDLAFADGLPAGLQEVTRVDKLRAKRAFEATLPPIDDAARLPLRQKMIEEWEAREWEEREREIQDIQERRLGLLENALQVREEDLDEEHRQRVEERKKATLAARAGRFADVQATRIKTMRQLIENRKYVEKHRKLHKPTIVERYANFGSGTYAPLQREGRFPESKPLGQEIETEGYEPASLKAVLELESFLPGRLLHPRVAAPKRPDRMDYGQRKEAAVQRDLKTINDLLDTAKGTAGRGYGDCWPAPLKEDSNGPPGSGGGLGVGGLGGSSSLKRASSSSMSKSGQAGLTASGGGLGAEKASGSAAAAAAAAAATVAAAPGSPPRRVMRAVERPSTPELPPPPALSQPQQAALVLLQRLLRGRAAQNIMYEGRLRRQELIDELRLSERLSADGTRFDGKPVRQPEERDAATLRVDELLGAAVSEVCVVLSESDPSRREVLMAALDTSRAHEAAAVFAAAATELSAAAAAAVAAAAAGLAAAAERSSSTSLALGAPPPAEPAATPSLREAALNLEALGISPEQAEEAAVRIQAAFHGHKARKEVAAMRERGAVLRRIMAAGDVGKVVKCQAAVRGYLGRKRVRHLREEQAAAAAPGAAEEQTSEAEAAEKFVPSPYTAEQVEAAKRIQAAQRGRVARRRIAAMRAEREGGSGAAAEAAEDDEPQVEGEGGDGVAEVEAPVAAAPPPPAPQPATDVHPDYTVEQEVAVIQIQAAGRKYLARRRVAAMREEKQQRQQQLGQQLPNRVAEAEAAMQRSPRRIGRQGDPGVIAAAEAEAAAVAVAATEPAAEAQVDGAAVAADGEEEVFWPKMRDLSGFVLAPAPRASGAGEAPPALGRARDDEGEGAAAPAAVAPDAEPSREAVQEASVSALPQAEGGVEPEASLERAESGGGEEAAAATELQPPNEEPSLAVGSSGGEADEPGPEASAACGGGEEEEKEEEGPAAGAENSAGGQGGEEGEGEAEWREEEGAGAAFGEPSGAGSGGDAQEGVEEAGGEGEPGADESAAAAAGEGEGEPRPGGEEGGEGIGESPSAPGEGEGEGEEGEPGDGGAEEDSGWAEGEAAGEEEEEGEGEPQEE